MMPQSSVAEPVIVETVRFQTQLAHSESEHNTSQRINLLHN